MHYLDNQGIDAIALTRADCEAAVTDGPIADKQALISKLSDADAVIHLAGRAHVLRDDKEAASRLFHEANVLLTEALSRLAVEAKVKRFVFISSIGVCGDSTSDAPFTEESVPHPTSEYAASKLQAEKGLRTTLQESSTELTIIRPPMVYSAAAPGNFHRLLGLVRSGVPLPFGSCANAKSVIAVENLVRFIHLCATHPKAKDELFLVSDITLSTRELVQRIAEGMNKRILLLPINDRLLHSVLARLNKLKIYTQLFGSLRIDSAKAHRLLEWQPDEKDYLRMAGAQFKALQKVR